MEKAYELYPSADCLLDWARFEHAYGETGFALDLAVQAISRDPDSRPGKEALVHYLKHLGRLEEATMWQC